MESLRIKKRVIFVGFCFKFATTPFQCLLYVLPHLKTSALDVIAFKGVSGQDTTTRTPAARICAN